MQVGLTGGIGSGKSTVAGMLEALGAYVIDSDELAREAVEPGSEGLRAVAALWPGVVHDGVLDRAALARIVFDDAAARARLNAIVHPIVRRFAAERSASALPGQLVVQMIPLLFETNSEGKFDKTIVVIAPEDARIERSIRRDGATQEQVRARIASQIPVDEARRRADYIIENDGDLEHVRRQVRLVYDALMNAT
ncbi:MAG: dephospho-CoA kinase [Vulcanimicrobiaceae bacterium]